MISAPSKSICRFCGSRCQVPFTSGTPLEIREAYETAQSMATCNRGQDYEMGQYGYCFETVTAAVKEVEKLERMMGPSCPLCHQTLRFIGASWWCASCQCWTTPERKIA